jgi:L-rhamnose mutarotase
MVIKKKKRAWYRYKERHVDQWNRIEDLHIKPHTYRYFIFDKDARNIQWEISIFNICYLLEEKVEKSLELIGTGGNF